ncbi:MAG: CBS domain-containing protein [Calditrichaeota bacterium]|nr:MAG: CBS domain-containing protein [Calditrichota bacterium]
MKKQTVSEFKPYEKALIIEENTSIQKMVTLALKHPRNRNLCVVNHKRELLGLIHRKRLFRAVFSHHVPPTSSIHELFTLLTSEIAGDILIRNVITTHPTQKIDDVIKIFIEHDLFEMPVINEEKKVLGLLSIDMILKEWLSEMDR